VGFLLHTASLAQNLLYSPRRAVRILAYECNLQMLLSNTLLQCSLRCVDYAHPFRYSARYTYRVHAMWLDTGETIDSEAIGGDVDEALLWWKKTYGDAKLLHLIMIDPRPIHDMNAGGDAKTKTLSAKRNTQSTMTDHEWGRKVNCTDAQTGRIGLFALLRLIANQYGLGTGYVNEFEDSSILAALREADPEMRHWHLEIKRSGRIDVPDVYVIWRRKEWNESYEKVKHDEVRKEVLFANEQEYQAAKKIVIDFFLEVFDGNRKVAETMFAPMANDHKKLIAKANTIKATLEKVKTK